MSDDNAARARRASVAIAPSVLLAGVAGGVAYPILPIVGVQSGLPLPFIGAILAANRAMRIVSSPVVGALADRFGGRRTLVAGLLLEVAVMGLYTLGITTHHPGVFFLAGRMLHGPGSACVFIAAQALALHAGGKSHGGRAVAGISAAMALGIPLGLVAGGVLSDRIGNAHTFEVGLGAIVVAGIAAVWRVPDLRVHAAKRVAATELRTALADRRVLAIGALNFATSFSAQGLVLTTLSLVVRARGVALLGLHDKGTSGLLMGTMIVFAAITMPIAARIGDKRRAHRAIAIGGLVALAPSLLIVALARHASGLVAGLTLMGVSAGALGPSLLALLGDIVPEAHRGTAVGVLQLFGDLGGTLGPLVGTALFAGGVRTPYIASAVALVCLVPVAARMLTETGEKSG